MSHSDSTPQRTGAAREWAGRLVSQLRRIALASGQADPVPEAMGLPSKMVIAFAPDRLTAWIPQAKGWGAPTNARRQRSGAAPAPPIDPVPVRRIAYRITHDQFVVAADEGVPLRADGFPDLRILTLPPSRWGELETRRAGRGPTTMPAQIVQPTHEEAKAVAIAYADGADGRNWRESESEFALIHAIYGSDIQIKLQPGLLPTWLGVPESYDLLRDELRQAGLPCVMLFYVLLGWLLESDIARVTQCDLDSLIRAIGWEPRSTDERAVMRKKLWRWILLFEATDVIGTRKGKWRNSVTREVLNLTTNSPLIRIVGTRPTAQQSLDGSEPPVTVSWVPGDWLMRFHGNSQVLQHFGDILRIAQIPAGQPSGAWAQSIGMALQQLWRQQASRLQIEGDTPRMNALTRRQILDLFRAEPFYHDVLKSSNPERAKRYWNGAIALLKQQGMIGEYRELAPLSAARQGWKEEWLDQPVEIRPARPWLPAIVELAASGQEARRKPGRPRKSRPSGMDR